MHVADWLSTFATLAGAEPTDSRAATLGLPPIDSMDMWPTIAMGTLSPRAEIVISDWAFIQWPYKIVCSGPDTTISGARHFPLDKCGVWTSAQHPNATLNATCNDYVGCSECSLPSSVFKDMQARSSISASEHASVPAASVGGCLFNLQDDPTEHVDLASTKPAVHLALAHAWSRAISLQPRFETLDTPRYTNCTTLADFGGRHGGFAGPVCSFDRT